MIGDRLELVHPDGSESFELRVDGRRVALVDRMLLESLIHWAKQGEPTPFLEVNAVPNRRA